MIIIERGDGRRFKLEDGDWTAVEEELAPPLSPEAIPLIETIAREAPVGAKDPDPELVVASHVAAELGGSVVEHKPDIGPLWRYAGGGRRDPVVH